MKNFGIALKLFIWLTLLTGVLYPLLITLIAQITMAEKAEGSLLYNKDKKIVGSSLIAQKFTSSKYFWPRPSAVNYNLPSGGSNLGPTSALLKKTVQQRKEVIAKAGDADLANIPSELLYASGSGLDPHISPVTAHFQVARIAKARNLNDKEKKGLSDLIDQMTIKKSFGFLGEPCVNVLLINRALDELYRGS